MPVDSRRQLQKTIRERKFLNKDFDGFRADLEEYARTYFPDRIRDFSSNALGGMFLELAAYVGDVQSFYMDHQFQELSPETAVEARNIERLLEDNGVQIVGASPAVVDVTFYFKIPIEPGSNPTVPDRTALPIVYAGTVVSSQSGINFELVEDLDFSEQDNGGNLKATIVIGDRDAASNPTNYILSREGLCISGQRAVESFGVNGFEPFKQYSITRENVTEVISVFDASGNEYFQVDFLTQDTVFRGLLNKGEDNELVKENIEIVPAAYRFFSRMSVQTRLTTLTFGGGTAETMDDDIVPDPSEFAIPLYGKQNFSRFTLNPSNLLRTATLGVLSPNTTVSIEYRYGGGLSHNIEPRTIRGVTTLQIGFPKNPSPSTAAFVRESIDALNLKEAAGGDDAPTLEELKFRIPGARAAQSRIVSKEDLVARIYTIPANFGRVFRASVRSNPNNPNASRLFVICRNANSELVVAPDALKKNLSKYLNQFRLISDAIDILDAQVINIQVQYKIAVASQQNKQLILQGVNAKLRSYFNIKNFEIDQPIGLSDIQNIIYNNTGVIGVQDVAVINISGIVGDKSYSGIQFSVQENTYKGNIIIPPAGGMFEVKFKDIDIIGIAL